MSPWVDTVAFAVTLIFMLVGLFGLIIPIFPGMLVMWVSAFAYGLITRGFDTLGIVIFILISIAAIAGMVVDNVLLGAGARVSGAAPSPATASSPLTDGSSSLSERCLSIRSRVRHSSGEENAAVALQEPLQAGCHGQLPAGVDLWIDRRMGGKTAKIP